jgi:NitT/TauT family transport system substrate-binding protein
MRRAMVRLILVAAAVLALLSAPSGAVELRITRQPGLIFLPMTILEHDKLIERRAAELGVKDLAVSWVTFATGAGSTDALLSGNVDMVATGSTNMLLLWDRTRGEVKAVSGEAALPMMLITRNPAVKTLKDFTANDRIAVPTVKVSIQAVVLQMAVAQQLGASQWNKLDELTVSMSHPQAMVALLNPHIEITAHFASPPYAEMELKQPGMHVVLRSEDVADGPVSNTLVMSTTKFRDANPKLVAAFLDAYDDAVDLIAKDKRGAAERYLAVTKEKGTVEELIELISQPSYIYSKSPYQMMKLASFMHQAGVIRTKPESWKDFFFPEVHALPGT